MTAKTLHALDYLFQAEKHPPRPVSAIYGDESFLRRQAVLKLREAVLGREEGDFSFTAFDGDNTELRVVLDELATVAMFGGVKRLVHFSSIHAFIQETIGKPIDESCPLVEPRKTGRLCIPW